MIKIIHKINTALSRVERLVGSVMVIVIVLLVFTNAVVRKMGSPISITQEGSQLLFIWISMLGADLALKQSSHMGVDILVRKLPQTPQRLLKVFSYVLCAGFLVFMLFWGVRLCATNYLRTYSSLGISYTTATVAIPFISLLMVLTIVEKLADLFKNWRNPLYDDSVDALDETNDAEEGRQAG